MLNSMFATMVRCLYPVRSPSKTRTAIRLIWAARKPLLCAAAVRLKNGHSAMALITDVDSNLPSGRLRSGLSILSLLVAALAKSFGKRGATPKVLATSATVSISKLNVDAALAACPDTTVLASGSALAVGYWQCFHLRLAPCGSRFQVSGQPPGANASG